jgi:archaellum biogenesis ATPase FlaH
MELIKHIIEVSEDYRPIGLPIKTGQNDFDRAMDGGVRGGEIITLSGSSGHGKTSYALWLTKLIAQSGVPCLWFTYEMNPFYLAEKFRKIMSDEELEAMPVFVPIKHDDKSEKFVEDRIIEAIQTQACKVVFIDHLHYLIPPENERNISLLIGGIVRALKLIAVKHDIIIYLIAHSRRLQTGERINAGAVRDSALIENESDYMLLVERLKKKEQQKGKMDTVVTDPYETEYTDIAKIILAKNRRTGEQLNRYYKVKAQAYQELDRAEVNELKNSVYL